MFGRRAVDIYREVAFCKADNIPPYQVRASLQVQAPQWLTLDLTVALLLQGEQVRLVLEEINQCTSRIEHLLK